MRKLALVGCVGTCKQNRKKPLGDTMKDPCVLTTAASVCRRVKKAQNNVKAGFVGYLGTTKQIGKCHLTQNKVNLGSQTAAFHYRRVQVAVYFPVLPVFKVNRGRLRNNCMW